MDILQEYGYENIYSFHTVVAEHLTRIIQLNSYICLFLDS